jgi:hypothetical protein
MSSVRPSLLEIAIRLTPGFLGANPYAYNKYIYRAFHNVLRGYKNLL